MDITPDVSVCVVTRNRLAAVQNQLQSLKATAEPVSFEVILVDNHGCDDLANVITSQLPGAIVIQNASCQVLAAARNQAIRRARGRYVLLSDDGLIFSPGCLQTLVTFMDDTPDAGIAGPLITDHEGNIAPTARTFPSLLYLFGHYSGLNLIYPDSFWQRNHFLSGWDYKNEREADWLLGACLLLRPEAIDEIGLLDERYQAIYEDADYCWRARRAGWHIHIIPAAQVTHHNPARYAPYSRPDSPTSPAWVGTGYPFGQLADAGRLVWKRWLDLIT